jgi:hypothetical protein
MYPSGDRHPIQKNTSKKKKKKLGIVAPIIPKFRRMRLENHEFKASLDYIVSLFSKKKSGHI